MNKNAHGFTIVELLIVIVVIAILAAISIVAYRGVQDRANASSASARVTQVATKLKLYYVEHESYPTLLSEADIQDVSNLQYTVDNVANPKTYCITATTANKSYYQNTTTAATPTAGGCPGHGVGGVQALTNYVLNPNIANTTAVFLNNSANASLAVSGGAAVATITANPTSVGNGMRFDTGGSAGNFYSAKLRVRGTGSAVGRTTYAQLWDSATRARSSDFVLSSSWQDIDVVASTQTTGAIKLYIYFAGAAGWAIGDTVQVTQPAVYQVTGTGQQASAGFFSGDSPNWIWNGTPNNSTSTGPAL